MLCWLLSYTTMAIGQAEPTTDNATATSASNMSQADHQQALSQALPAKEVIWLQAEGERFLALYLNEQSGSARGGIIILAEHYHQPSERYWINNLRHTLPEKQWHSLVLAIPQQKASQADTTKTAPTPSATTETEPSATSPTTGQNQVTNDNSGANASDKNPDSDAEKENNQRQALAAIDAAINYYNAQGVFNVAIISEGASAIYALQYISNISNTEKRKQIRGLALVNARNQFNDTSIIELMAAQQLPILDIYLGLDYRDQREAQQRKVASRQLSPGQYVQVAIPRTATSWDSREDRLSKRVRGWLDRTASGFEVNK